MREICASHPIALVNSVNPFRLEGQKTAAFEVVDALGQAPDYHAMPVGNAGNITAYWKGYTEYQAAGECATLPKMLGFQASGAAPLVTGQPVAKPETLATAIRIGNPASWQGAIAARNESGGLIDSVTDAEILDAYRLLPTLEGIFVEPGQRRARLPDYANWPRRVISRSPQRLLSLSPDTASKTRIRLSGSPARP